MDPLTILLQMSKVFQEVFAGSLPPKFSPGMDQLPSPKELMYKILVKTSVSKTTPQELVEITHLEGGERKEEGEDGKKLKMKDKDKEKEKEEIEKNEEDDALESALKNSMKKAGANKFNVNMISSVSESTLASHYRDSLESLVELNKTHLTRVYPMVWSWKYFFFSVFF